MWIARDDYGLWLFVNEPTKTILYGDKYFIKRDNVRYSIDSNLFPEITFENSPKEVRFELVEEDLVEKACKWLQEDLYNTCDSLGNKSFESSEYYTVEEFIEAFRKFLKTNSI